MHPGLVKIWQACTMITCKKRKRFVKPHEVENLEIAIVSLGHEENYHYSQ